MRASKPPAARVPPPNLPPHRPRAVVMCRQAGYATGTAGVGAADAGLAYREWGRAPVLGRLSCNGTEADLTECGFRWVPPLPYSPYFNYVPRTGSLSYFTGPLLPLLYCPPAFNDTGGGRVAGAASCCWPALHAAVLCWCLPLVCAARRLPAPSHAHVLSHLSSSHVCRC